MRFAAILMLVFGFASKPPTAAAAQAHELTTAQSAHLFALLNLSFADGVIAFYDAKYTSSKRVAENPRRWHGRPVARHKATRGGLAMRARTNDE